jgi:ribosomal protein S2
MKLHAKNLIAICGHLGTHKFNWQPESERFAIGYRSSVLIYNLSNSSFYLNRAINFLEKLVFKYGRTYVYGLHHERDKKWIKKFSFINQVVSTEGWRGGYVTNAKTFHGKIKNIKKRFAAIISLSYDYQNYSLPREAHIMNIPAISVVDSNVRAENFSYPIPINSSSIGGIRMLAYTFGLHIFKGLTKRIISRFSKKKKMMKIKDGKKRGILKTRYFKKIRKVLKKKVKAKRKLQKWIKKFRKLKYKERREAKQAKQRKKFRLNKVKRKKKYLKPRKKIPNKNLSKTRREVKAKRFNNFNKKNNKHKKFYRAKNKSFKARNNGRRSKFRRAARLSRFSRIKAKLGRLKKIKLFKKVFRTSAGHKISRFFFRRFKKTVTAYKYVNIYTFLRGKKSKLLKLKNLKKRRQRLYQKRKEKKSKKRYRYFYYNNMFIKKLKKKKSYFPIL